MNTPGSFRCDCHAGYQVAPTKDECHGSDDDDDDDDDGVMVVVGLAVASEAAVIHVFLKRARSTVKILRHQQVLKTDEYDGWFISVRSSVKSKISRKQLNK